MAAPLRAENSHVDATPDHDLEALGPPKNLAECDGYTIYKWPRITDEVQKSPRSLRLKALGDQIDLYAKTVGKCYARKPVGKSEKTWLSGDRDERVRATYNRKTPLRYCMAVKSQYVDKLLPRSKSDPSPYCQYGNCGEGAEVGACLAYDYGFHSDEIIECYSKHDHVWSLVPETPGSKNYCLLDRWNSYRCGVHLKYKKQDDGRFLDASAEVPGTAQFKFSDATCMTLEERARH